MPYLAIARKYRPATFADIVGQEHVVRTLENALRSGRVHHAYLFCGARGVGKTTAARAFAKSLNCVQGPTPEPCGVCPSCTEIANANSPDLIEIDGASNNSVDDVRDLRETVHYAPTRGKYKVYLVDEVHMLSKAAFNALLKTLEEPPPHVVFLFATTEPNRILETILSRVQRFDFKRIGVQPVADRLGSIAIAEGVKVSQQALRMIARAGDGSMRDAQSLLDKVISFAGTGEVADVMVAETLGLVDRGLLFGFLEGMLTADAATCLEIVATVYEYGYELSEFTIELLEVVRNAALVKLSDRAKAFVDVSQDEIERLEAITKDVPVDLLDRTFHALLDVHDQVSRATRPRIVLEMAVARLATQRPIEPVAGLLAKLEALERKIRPTAGSTRARPATKTARIAAPPPRAAVGGTKPALPKNAGPSVLTAAEPSGVPPVASIATPAPAPKPKAQPRRSKPVESRPPSRDGDGEARGFGHPLDVYDEDHARWQKAVSQLRELGKRIPGAARLADGTCTLRGSTLLIAVAAGRPLAEARRARGIPEVEGVLRTSFPGLDGIELVSIAGSGTPAENQEALRQRALANPELQRIATRLGAELESVVEIDE